MPSLANNGQAQAVCTTAESAIGYIPYNTLTIKDSANNNCITAPDFAAAVIISHGKSGGYYNDNSTIQPCNSNDLEKNANSNRKGIYFTKPLQLKDNAIFDDQLLFVSRNNLMAIWAQTPCKRQ